MKIFWNVLLVAVIVGALLRACAGAIVKEQEHEDEVRAQRCADWYQAGTLTPEMEDYCNNLGV